MTESKRKAQTVYGDVDFDTRTCASCEQEYLPEDTVRVYLGDEKGRYKNTYVVKITFNRESLKELYFCKNCVKRPIQLKINPKPKTYVFVGSMLSVLFLIFIFIIIILGGTLL